MTKKFQLFRSKIIFNDDLLQYDYLRSNYCELYSEWESSFNQYYDKEVISIEKLNQALELFSNEFNKVIDFSVFVIMEKGIDYVDKSKFIDILEEEFPEFDPFYAVEKSVDQVKEAAEEVARHIQVSRAAERSNRSHWEGGGFGIAGALTGAFKAGALNLATSALRGIGDSITDSRDKSKFKKFIKDSLQNPEYGIKNSFIASTKLIYLHCLYTTYFFLIKQGKISKCLLNIDSYEAKINNYIKFGDFNTAYDYLIKAIQINPYEVNLYNHLYSLVDKLAKNDSQKELFTEELDGLVDFFKPYIFEV